MVIERMFDVNASRPPQRTEPNEPVASLGIVAG